MQLLKSLYITKLKGFDFLIKANGLHKGNNQIDISSTTCHHTTIVALLYSLYQFILYLFLSVFWVIECNKCCNLQDKSHNNICFIIFSMLLIECNIEFVFCVTTIVVSIVILWNATIVVFRITRIRIYLNNSLSLDKTTALYTNIFPGRRFMSFP